MFLNRLASFFLLPAVFCFSLEVDLPLFQNSPPPPKMKMEHLLENSLRTEEIAYSFVEDTSLSIQKPSLQSIAFHNDFILPQVTTHDVFASFFPKEMEIEIQNQFLTNSSVEYFKFHPSLKEYSIIPWRIVKNIALSPTLKDLSYNTEIYSACKEEAVLDTIENETFYIVTETLPTIFKTFYFSREGVLNIPFYSTLSFPKENFFYKNSSSQLRHKNHSPYAEYLVNNLTTAYTFTPIINENQRLTYTQSIEYPILSLKEYELYTLKANAPEIMDSIDHASKTPSVLFAGASSFSYKPSSQTVIYGDLDQIPILASDTVISKNTLFDRIQGKTGDNALKYLPIENTSDLIVFNNDSFILKSIMASHLAFLSYRDNSLCEHDKNGVFATDIQTEKITQPSPIEPPFISTQTEIFEIAIINPQVESFFLTHISTPTQKLITEYRDHSFFLTSEAPKKSFIQISPFSTAATYLSEEGSPFLLNNQYAIHTLEKYPSSYSFHFQLDKEMGYRAFTNTYQPNKPLRSLADMPTFYGQNDAFTFPFSKTQALHQILSRAEEVELLPQNNLTIATLSEKGIHSLPFDEEKECIAVYTSNDSQYTAPTEIPYIQTAVLPLPDTTFLSTILCEDAIAENFAREEAIHMLDFGKEIGKAFSSLFPQHLVQTNSNVTPSFVNLHQGIPQLKSHDLSVSYSLNQSKYINDGYRLTSYNLTRLPTPEELDIDEYVDSLTTKIEVTPRKDGKGYYFALTLSPEKEEEFTKTPQNVVFFLDRTSTILAPRYDSYRKGVLRALQYLNEGDTFNIVVIDSQLHYFETKPVPVTRATIRRARRFLQDLSFPMLKRTSVDLYDLLYELNDYFENNGNIHTAVLVSDGISLFDMDHKRDTLRTILQRNQGKVTLHCAAASGKNNNSMLDIISTFHSGEYVYSHSMAAFPRKLARLIKKTNGLISNNVHISTVNEDRTLDIDFFTSNERMPHLYAGKSFTIYGSINRLQDFKIVLQGKVGSRFMHFAKDISFTSAQKAPPGFYRLASINKAYACYDLYLKEKDPNYLSEAKGLLQKYKLPAATKRRAPTNEKRLMRERLDIF